MYVSMLYYTVCVPTIVGKECTEKVNGTCVTEVPKVEDCGM